MCLNVKSIKVEMKKEIYIPIFGIIAGEAILFYGQITIALWMDMVNILLITFIIIFSNLKIKEKNVLQSSTLLIILRTINVSIPRFFAPLLQYVLIYGIMFIPIYLIVKNQQISYKELGINFSRLYIYIPLAIIIGVITAIVEYKILSPMASMQKIITPNLIFLGIVMFMFIGIVEEMTFRSIFQTRIEKILGTRKSILLSGGIFGIMHSSYGILYEVLFVAMVGIIMGYIFHKTQSLPFIVSIHGVTNVILFGILPLTI
mgnify:CR=1 FL=1